MSGYYDPAARRPHPLIELSTNIHEFSQYPEYAKQAVKHGKLSVPTITDRQAALVVAGAL